MQPTLTPPHFAFTKVTLPNGLDVIARRQGDLPIVAMNLWYHVGSKNEERSRRGFAHLFEHLMFEGSLHYPGDYFKPLQRLGASINGSTSSDRTNYFVDLPTAHLAQALAMESDRMGYFLPALTEEKIRVQKDVVKNEYRQNYSNRPYGQAGRLIAEMMYPPEHPYSWLTIGVMEDVEAATKGDVESFFQRYYVPSNASLAIVGDIDESEAIDQAARYFGDLPGGTAAVRPWTPSSEPDRKSIGLTLHDRVELDRLYLSWHTVPHFVEDDAPLVLLADILTRGRSSRLYRRLVIEEETAQDISSYQSGRELAGSFGITATLRPNRSWEVVRDRIDTELATIAAEGVEPDELRRVLNGRLAGFIYALDNVGGFGGVADRLNAYNIYLGEPGRITSDLLRYQRVTIEQIREVAERFLANRPRVALTVKRKPAVTTGLPLDRATAPGSKPSAAFRVPKPSVHTLRCGTPLWVIPKRELPIVAMSCIVLAGAGAHAPEQGGLSSLTSNLIDEGTTTRSARELALAAENIGTHLSTDTGWDGSYVGMQCLTPHLDESLELALDILRNPTFPQEEFDRIKGQTLAARKADREKAEVRASRGLASALYPRDHPYGVSTEGSEESVSRLSRADLQAFHRAHYQPGRTAIVVAGDVDPDAIVDRLDRCLAGWNAPTDAIPKPPSVVSGGGRILVLNRPGASQAVVRVGHLGTDRLDPDHASLLLVNQILGGQFTSRLNAKLREEKGFTYGVRSHFDFRRTAGPFVIGASLESDRLDEALADLRAEVVGLLDDRPPTHHELEDARRSLIEGQARGFETPSSLATRYAGLFLYGFPPDYHVGFADRLNAVTLDSMREAADRRIRPDEFVIVVVADAQAVRPGLERLGWGEVECFDESVHEFPPPSK